MTAARDGSVALSIPGVLTDPAVRQALIWEPFREGLEISWLYQAPDFDGPSAAFLKYAPGAHVPTHEHPGFEHILVLEGSQRDQNGLHEAGAVVINPPKTQHAVTSDDGCIVLAIWQMPVRFL
ncbi:MAG: cupin domain-containing protein [Rhodospirillales bacterium]